MLLRLFVFNERGAQHKDAYADLATKEYMDTYGVVRGTVAEK